MSESEFLHNISGFLGGYYVTLAIMNGIAALRIWLSGKDRSHGRIPIANVPFTTSLIWLIVSISFMLMGALALGGFTSLLALPESVRDTADRLFSPTVYSVGSLLVLSILFVGRRFFTRPMVAWVMLNLALLFVGLSLTDVNFALIVTKPDNVPIVAMVFLLAFFTWLSAHRAVQNDDRIAQGLEPLEKLEKDKVLVWPDLVYTELICMVALTAVLLLWAIVLKAPLEEPASAVKTPNPSKAPWYFLGLQEMLVYYDPWMAGVVLPSLVVFGLMAIPYLDFNRNGNGYYTINQRKFAYLTFQFGFLVLWVTLIVMGTFLRGPNWNFFGIYEQWDAHKVEALNNVDLSEYFWISFLNRARPRPPDGSSVPVKLAWIAYRESPGILLTIIYLGVVPPAMAIYSKFFRGLFVRMGFLRYMLMTNLLLIMGLLPLKMVLRWSLNMKYFISIPEYLTNF